MSVSLDTNSLAQQIKDVALDAVNTVQEAVVGSSAEVEDKHRIFVGNLSFETTEDELRSYFSTVGEVVSVTIPSKRNGRAKSAAPSAIAFVGYTSDADVQKAVETLNGQSLGENEITVAVARPIQESKQRTKSVKTAIKSEGQDAEATAEGTPGTQESNGEKKKPKRKPRTRKSVGDAAPDAETTNTDAVTSKAPETPAKARTPRSPRQKGPPTDGTPSETTLFVAGLDHKTTDGELKEIFSKYHPTTAHVALRPIRRYMVKKLAEKGEQRLGRGFGFVSFADQSAQQEALKGMEGYTLGERELAVKVAIDASEKAEVAVPNGYSSTALVA